jgi:hypothetical protein
MSNLAAAYRDAGQRDRSIALSERTLELKRAKFGEDHPSTLNEMAFLALALDGAGVEPQRALVLFEETLQRRRTKLGDDDPNTHNAMDALGNARLRRGDAAGAETVLRESVTRRAKVAPDDPRSFYSRVLLGRALVDQKKLDEAEPMLLVGYEGLLARADKVPPNERGRVRAAAQALVTLYDQWGKTDEAAKWRPKAEAPQRSTSTQPATSTPPASRPDA